LSSVSSNYDLKSYSDVALMIIEMAITPATNSSNASFSSEELFAYIS